MVYDKGESTRASTAIKHLRENSFTAANGDRADAANLGILITDGQAKDPFRTQFEAKLVHIGRHIIYFMVPHETSRLSNLIMFLS